MAEYSSAVADAPGGALLRLRVTPRARTTRLEGISGDAARLRVAAPPADGKANAAVLAYLASALGVRSRDLELARGVRGREKTVRVEGLDAATVAGRLGSARR